MLYSANLDEPCGPSDELLSMLRKLGDISDEDCSTHSLAVVAFLHLLCYIAARDG